MKTQRDILNDSLRLDSNKVALSVAAESLLCCLLGESMVNIHNGTLKQQEWMNILKKISGAIERAIEQNIISDEYHKSRIMVHKDILIKASSSKENTDPQYILALVAIIFELLGGIPYYGDRSKLNKKNDFSLNALRTIHYLQDDYQKACTIMKASG